LQLVALSLQGRDDRAAFIQDFKGDNRYIMDYLIEEVLKLQTPEQTKWWIIPGRISQKHRIHSILSLMPWGKRVNLTV
jgi:LuxR family maltose regulon positive regulatory protein